MKTSPLKGPILTTPQVFTKQRLKNISSSQLWCSVKRCDQCQYQPQRLEMISRCTISLTNWRNQKTFIVSKENGGLSFSDLALAPVLAFVWPSESVLFLSLHE